MRLQRSDLRNIWGRTRRYGGAIVAFGALIFGASRCSDLTAPTGLSSVSILFRGIPLPRPDTIQLIVGDKTSPDIVVMLGTQEQPRARHVFASSDTNVVKVYAQGDSIEVTGRGFARLIVSLVGATIGGTLIDPNTRTADTVTVAAAAASNVVTPSTLLLEAFTAKATLTAQSLGRNNQVIEGTDVVWRSLNPGIASVNPATGEVTAVGNGTTDIYAVFEGVDSTFSRVTVAQKLKKYRLSTATGASFRSINETMPVISTPLDSLGVPFGPNSVTPAAPSFQSSKPGQVEIHPTTGLMTARANTNATDLPLMTATAAGAVVSDPLGVAVVQVAKTIAIALPPNVTISSIGAKLENVAVSALDSLGTQVPVIKWDIFPINGVVSVDGNQTATIIAQQTGFTYVRAKADLAIDSVRLTVTNDPATVELSPKPFALTSLNQSGTLTATARNAAGTVLTSGVTLTWLSRDSTIVEPQPTQGVMVARALGETRIVVTTQNNVSDSITVRVTNAPDTVRIIPDTIRLTNVGDVNNAFAVDFKNGLGATLGKSSVTWISADVNVAQVAVGTGAITAIGSGITYVLAVSPENPVRRDSVFVVVTNDAASMTVSPSSAQTLTSFGATLNFSATVFNSAGNPIAGAPVAWSVPVGGAFLSIDAVTGVATAVANGPATVRATSGGVTRDVSVTVAQAFSPARSTITPTAASIVANGTSTTTITVQLKDANDNNLTFGGDNVVPSVSPAGIGTLGPVPATDAGNGRYTTTLTSSTTAGTATISATVNAIAIANNAIVAMTAGAAAKYLVTSTSLTPVAGSSVTIRAQLADANNNPVATGGNAVTFSSTNGGTFTGANPAATDGTGAAQITFNTSTTASTHTVSATTGGLTGASPAINSVAASASSYLVTPATTSPAAGSVVTITAQLRDANGNAVAQPGLVVTWTKSDPNGAFSSGGSSNTNASGVASINLTTHTVANTATTVTATTTGTPTLMGTSATITTTPGAASTATTQITTNVGTVIAGGQATVTVQAIDANTNNLTASGGAVLLSTTLGTLSAVTDNANGTYTATLSTTAAGTATITGTLNGIAITDNAVVTVTVTGATASAAQSIASVPAGTAGSLTTISIQARDQFGNNMQSGGSTVQVTVSGANTVAQFTAADNGNGTYTATYTPTIAGTDNIAIALGGTPISGSPYSSVVNAGGLANFLVDAFGPIPTQAAGTAFNITITARDASGNTVTTFSAGSNTVDISSTGTLSAGGGTTGAFTNGVLTRSVTISNTGNFFITATRTTGGTESGTSNTFTVTAGAASLTTSTITAVSNAITADQTTAITVTLRDANSNPLTASGGTVALTPSIGTLSSVTNNSNGTYSAIYTATTAGTATITGTLNGAGFTDNEVITVTPGVASAATTTITASPTSVPADGVATSTITVQAKDADGNNLTTEADVVVLTANPGAVNLPVSAGAAGTGTYTATLPASTSAGLVTVTGAINGAAITDNATVTRTAGAATGYTVTPASLNVASGGTVLVTAQLVDGSGNPVATSGKTVSWTSNQNGGAFAGGAQFPTPFSTTDASGAAVIAFTVSTTAGNVHRVRATDNTALTGTSPADIVVSAGAVSGANSTIAASPLTIETTGANGSPTSSAITVTLRDGSGNIRSAGGDAVVLNTSLGSLSAVTDNLNGTYSATLTSATTGTANVTGTGNGVNITGATASVSVVAAPSGANSSIAATPTTIETTGANGAPTTSAVTVTLRDGTNAQLTHGNDVVVLNTSLGSLGAVTDNGDGTYTATLTAGAAAGTANITGTVNGAAIGTPAAVTIVLAPSGANSSIAATPTTIETTGANGSPTTSAVTVTLRDGANVQLTHGNDAVVLNTSLGSLGAVTDNGDGTYTATLTAGATAGTANITGTVNGAAIGTPAAVTIVLAPSGANSSIAAAPTLIAADGAATSNITVTLRDGANVQLTHGADAVVLNTTRGSLGSVTDNGDGTYSAVLTSSTEATTETATVSGTVNGAAIGTSAIVTFSAANGANSSIAATPTTIETTGANGSPTTSAITVTLRNGANAPLSTGGDVVVLNTDLGSLGAVTDNGDGTYTATLTAGAAAGTANITGTVNGVAIGTPAAVTIVLAPSGANSAITGPANVTAGNSATITVTLSDAAATQLTHGGDGPPALVLNTTRGTLSFDSDNGNGTYTFTLSTVAGDAGQTATITGTINGAAIGTPAAVPIIP